VITTGCFLFIQHNCVQRAVKPEFSSGKIKKKHIGVSDINNACGRKRILPDLEKYSTKSELCIIKIKLGSQLNIRKRRLERRNDNPSMNVFLWEDFEHDIKIGFEEEKG
jgi:hypothetical protein